MLELTESNFEAEVLESEQPVLVDFWAPWCGPCQQMGPILEQLAEEYTQKGIKMAKLNVDDNGPTAAQYGIMSIPTFILFKGGSDVDKLTGAVPKEKIEELLSKHAA